MSTKITNADYVKILNYYKINIPKSKKLLQTTAENIMAEKLCRCVNKLEPVYKERSIGICSKNIFNKKGFKRGNFTCKGNRKVSFSKNTKRRYTKK